MSAEVPTEGGTEEGEYEVVQDGPTSTEPIVVLGCLDETALNYNPEANEDDDSCEYEIVQDEPSGQEEGIGGPS